MDVYVPVEYKTRPTKDGRFGSKVGQIGPQMGQIRCFFISDFSAFGAGAPNALKSDLKKTRICPIWGQSDPLWSQTYHPWQTKQVKNGGIKRTSRLNKE